ncbi:DUF2634 domain-containing protein [Bacillus pumilus]|uniref:DUF2634 domain-containing protein n=1 Tax=Bacillus TaxID=1386 RepID=UPI000D04612E|nr:DUF2634 domain-containing protein [Bacillus pumilus]MCY7500686.1 DUF2634 domain-containing protein [Bacillus pumilus]MCY7526528.1 DUF2634 domain-containing protein [Bacillus pumilus]MED4439051.1 DUF2634 domain-containing protein [Bacillus pumilus]MED4491444.1 DUF2634 domain-containing protein [Bacillus pumilus]MED4628014.1 DUF2634 domain-containing protein [Bacillus pumilus]
MALSPEEEIEDMDEDEEDVVESSTTYRIDFESGRLTNEKINGLDAIRQFVYMALRTERYSHAIYSHDVGCEVQEAVSDEESTDEYKEMEIPRLIEEALLVDERIESVQDFEITKEGATFKVVFNVVTDEGTLEIEEVIGENV